MAGERRIRILAQLVDATGLDVATDRLCSVCAGVSGLGGAGIMLMTHGAPRGSVCASNDMSALVEQLQFDLGEGPALDAHDQGRPVLEPNLDAPATPRWLAFTAPALHAGVRSVFSFPVCVGAVRLGAMSLYGVRRGPLSDDQHADALVLADVVAEALLMMQSDAPAGLLADQFEAGGNFQYVVHQASGMVAAQLEVGVGEALARLRGFSFANGRPLNEVARQVVARSLRFADARDEEDPPP